MKPSFLTALAATVTLMLPVTLAHAGERYLSADIIGGTTDDDFGGVNTLGGFSNADNGNDTHYGLSLSYGFRDAYTISGVKLTPELEFAWLNDRTTDSASFPGAPVPAFVYSTSIESFRLGANVWLPVHEGSLWRTELGLGGGLLYSDISTTDGVVAGSGDEVTGYGQIGIRSLRAVGPRSNLKIGLNYVRAGETDIDLDGGASGTYSVQTDSLELRLGFELKLN